MAITFLSNLTVSGGGITLEGTGRIQGVDTVTANTDAANKLYVDNAVASVPVGDLTAVLEGDGIDVTSSTGPQPTVAVDSTVVRTSGTQTISGLKTFSNNVELANTADLKFVDLAGTFPTSGKGFDWTLNNDGARIYAIQPSSDSIDLTFELRDNATTNDRFVFFVNDYQGSSFDKYPLVIRGGTQFDLVDSSLYTDGTIRLSNAGVLSNVTNTNWDAAYNDRITAISDSGSSTITLTLTQQDGGTLTTSFSNPQGTVTGVTGTSPISSSGGTTPAISIATANGSTTGALSSSDWTTFNNKTTNTGTVTSVGGTGTVSGLTLTGSVTTSGNLTLGGTLSLSSANVTGALGFTPYSNANPSNFTSFAEPGIFSGGGTPTLASGVTASEVRTLIGAGTSSSSGVTGVSGTTPISSSNTGSGSTTISIATANSSTTGALTSTDWNTFNSKTTNTGTVTSVGLSAAGDALQVTGTPVTTSGTLALSFQGETEEYINGEGDLTTFPTIPSAANNATVTISAGTGLTGGGSFTVNQSGNSTITLNASGSGTVTSVTGTSPIVSSGGTTPAISINTNLITTLSGLTSTGRITSGTWSANTQLNVSAATDYSYQGERVFFGSGTVTEGKVYNFTSGGSWVLADADSESTSKGLLAIATGNGTASSVGMLTRGMYTLSTDPGTIGNSVFLSSTAGSLEDGAPTASGRIVRIVGTVLDSTNGQIFFHPDNTFITLS